MLFGEKCKIIDAKLHGNINGSNGSPHCQLDCICNHLGFIPLVACESISKEL